MIDIVKNSLLEAKEGLDNLINNKDSLEKIVEASKIMVTQLKKGGKILSFGNGGSCCDAMHFAEELSGKFRLDRSPIPALAVSDPSYMTCTSNDYGYEKVFSRYAQAFCSENDCILGISTSGNSKNVIEAVSVCNQKNVPSIVLTGRHGSELEKMATLCIVTPAGKYADRVQELHIKVIHILIELIEKGMNS